MCCEGLCCGRSPGTRAQELAGDGGGGEAVGGVTARKARRRCGGLGESGPERPRRFAFQVEFVRCPRCCQYSDSYCK